MRLLCLLLGIMLLTACIAASAPSPSGAPAATAPSTNPAPKPVSTMPPKESFDIYILMGQSNMVGRDTSTLDKQVDNPRILAFTADDQWAVAREPITPKVGTIAVGMGPGISFAATLLKADSTNPSRHIGLVATAVGGTPLRRWVKGGDLYEAAVARAKRAAPAGTIRGVLWHQGESDSDAQANAQTYQPRLIQMFKDLRADLNSPDLPIVVGQLGDFLTVDKHAYINTVRDALRQMPDKLLHVGYADAKDLTDKGDDLHFTADSQVTFGTRYAQAMLALTRPATKPATTTAPAAAAGRALPAVTIAPFAGNRAAAISYTFDDNLRDQYTLILPMLNELGIKGTFFVIPAKTAETPAEGEQKQKDPEVRGKWGGISWPELKQISDQGHEIASHTWDHSNLTSKSAADIDAAFSKANDAILAHIGKPALTLAFPGNSSNALVQAEALKYYVAFRSFQEATSDKSTVASLNAWADKLVQDKKWGVMMTHALVDGYAAMTDPDLFHTHLKYVNSRQADVWVDTFANISRYNLERENARLSLTSTPTGMQLTLTSTLDPATFNIPLTLVIPIPNTTTVTATRDGTSLPVQVTRNNILVDVVPSSKAIAIEWQVGKN